MKTNTGRYDKRVTIQTRSSDEDAAGIPKNEWTDGVTRWAALEALSGTEPFTNQGENNLIKWRVRMRYEKGLLTEANRLKFTDLNGTDHLIDVEAVLNPLESNEEYLINGVERI